MKIAYYDSKPQKYEAVGNGSYVYRWAIEEVQTDMSATNTQSTPVTQWKCLEVTVWGTVNSNKIIVSVINAKWGSGVEEKKINDYNASQLGILDKSYADSYRAFLTERKVIKEQIEADCLALGIPV